MATKQVALRMSRNDLDALARYAVEQDRTVSACIRLAVKDWITEQEALAKRGDGGRVRRSRRAA
jgi:hypothetical protein